MKLNEKQTIKTSLEDHKDATTNHESGLAFNLSPKAKLMQMVLTTLLGEPKFYKNVVEGKDVKHEDKILDTIKEVAKEDPEFILKLANYSRNEMFLRTVSIVLLVEAANLPELKCKPGETSLVKKYVPLVVKRADEIMEVLAYQFGRFGKPIPNALLRGLKNTFGNFDAYQLSKYDRPGKVKLKDSLRIIHPKPLNDEKSELYNKVKNDTLESPETWEVILSNWSKKGFKSKSEAWVHIVNNVWLKDGKVFNIMAIVRNLRNLLENINDVELLSKVCNAIKNPEAVRKSKMFPFRFFSAYKEIEGNSNVMASKVMDALQVALDVSVENLPKLGGVSFLCADNSGSMYSPLSERSKVEYVDIANIMQSISNEMFDLSYTSVFGTDFVPVNISSRDGILTNMNKFKSTVTGYGTNGYLIFEYLLNNNLKVDRVLVFTDLEMWNSYNDKSFAEMFRKYKSSINPNVKLYLFNLNGYGTCVTPEDEPNVCLISGWSEKVLKYIEFFEKDKQTMIDEVSKW